MFLENLVKTSADLVLFFSCLFILAGSIFISIKMRFIQIRLLPELFKMFFSSFSKRHSNDNRHTILPHRALFTAMSTTLRISTIVAPVIAIHLGGPGALLGFLFTSFFGSAATFMEVRLSIEHRKRLASGEVMGGPMQYLKDIFSVSTAKWYAIFCLVMMMAWSGAQANQLAAILDSPFLGSLGIPTIYSGIIIALFAMLVLVGGIKRIGSISAKLVPLMFILYIGSSLWILICNIDRLGEIFHAMFQGLFSPYQMATGTLVGGFVSALRWGIFKGTQACEAGIGTQAIPHSMAETNDSESQGVLAMLSTYTAGLVAFLSGCVTLLTKTWQDPSLPLGISMVVDSFKMYFSYFGIFIIAVSTFLFGFGTILGNSYNGSQCFLYLTENKNIRYYFLLTAVMIFLGAISDVKTVWSIVDLILAGVALPHMAALMFWAWKKSPVLQKNQMQ